MKTLIYTISLGLALITVPLVGMADTASAQLTNSSGDSNYVLALKGNCTAAQGGLLTASPAPTLNNNSTTQWTVKGKAGQQASASCTYNINSKSGNNTWGSVEMYADSVTGSQHFVLKVGSYPPKGHPAVTVCVQKVQGQPAQYTVTNGTPSKSGSCFTSNPQG